jgi:hypothetical protein
MHMTKLVIIVFVYSFKFSSGSQVFSLSLKPFHFISTQEVYPVVVSYSKKTVETINFTFFSPLPLIS